jgi:predicted dehydrogenase
MTSIGIIGCGAVVQTFYAETIRGHSAYAVDMVADLNRQQAAAAAAVFGARIETAEAIAATADAVIIATPPAAHAALIRQCFRQGRTILCEKPFTTSFTEAQDLVAEARESDTRLCVGHFRRLYPQVELARRLADLGLLGDILTIMASEGGRFTWQAVSDYTTRDHAGGVLWDTGSHTLDMALFACGLDDLDDFTLEDLVVTRDQPEPSHEFTGAARLVGSHSVDLHLRLSRRRALPNFVKITGSQANLSFVVGMDYRVRLSTSSGSVVLTADRTLDQPLECFDLQLQKVFLGDGAEVFEAARFLAQIKILEDFSLA